MPLFRRKPKEQPPAAPPGYRAVHQDQLDSWLEPLCDEVFELSAVEVPQYIGLAFMQEGLQHTDGQGNEALQYVRTAAALGYFARVVEFRALKLDERNDDLRDFLEWAMDQQTYGEDWFATMYGAANILANTSESPDPLSEQAAALVAPEGMGRDGRARFAGHLVLGIADTDGKPRFGIESRVMMRAWRVGYYLRACDQALPDAAIRELLAAGDD